MVIEKEAANYSMDLTEITGIAAGCLTSTSTFPQLIKTWKTKDARDISVVMFSVLLAGLILWTVYGVMRSDLPIIATNLLASVLNCIMLYFKYRFGKSEK
jgi:MtN3 and saliva related transmembrane protein